MRIQLVAPGPFEVRSIRAELYDTQAVLVASPQYGTLPVVPFQITTPAAELAPSFLAGAGAAVIGGMVRALVIGVDAQGVEWRASADATVVG